MAKALWTSGGLQETAGAHKALSHVAAQLPSIWPKTIAQPGDHEVLAYAARLALAPTTMRSRHLQPLREAGFSDPEIADLVHVICCFSYMNRLADGLGVSIHETMQSWAAQLLGPERLGAHLRWADPKPADAVDHEDGK